METFLCIILCCVTFLLGSGGVYAVMRYGSKAMKDLLPLLIAFVSDAVDAFRDGHLSRVEAERLAIRGQNIINALCTIGEAERSEKNGS